MNLMEKYMKNQRVEDFYSEIAVCKNGHIHAVLLDSGKNVGPDPSFTGQQECPVCWKFASSEDIIP